MHILVVDDHPIICDALAKYLEQIGPQVSPTPIRVTSAHTLADAIKLAKSADRPDLVFLDLNLDRENRAAATLQRFQESQDGIEKVPVVVFTGLSLGDEGTIEILRLCLNELDAHTIVMKGTNLATMFVGLPRILAGEKWMSDEIIKALLRAPPPNRFLDLTPRQWDVARGLTRGLRNQEIANELKLSEGTVRQIISDIYKRLGVHSRIAVGNQVRAADAKRTS
jgi:two-component system nitrate/nitrite response regulator NarL